VSRAAALKQPAPDAPDALAALVDTARYPVDELDSPAARALIAESRARLAETGCLVLRDFLRPDGLDAVAAEARTLAPQAHHRHTQTNPYDCADDPALDAGDPRRMFMDRSNGFVAGDLIGPQTALRRLYTDDGFTRFVAACVGAEAIHRYADPLADLVINVLRPGCQHPWHFDTTAFVVSLLTREPEGGGVFEYCPGIRSPEHENFAEVGAVLRGESDRPRRLVLRPGDLQIFFGRYSLHRVTRVEGKSDRHTVIFGYAEKPGIVGRAERSRQLFGRVAPVHAAEERAALVRADTLTD
jgi:hypothetical protein